MTMRHLCLLAIALSLYHASYGADDPVANPKSTVTTGNARFTILTPQLIRMEWSEDAVFEDSASLTFVNRNLPTPKFTVKQTGKKLFIETSNIKLTYVKGQKFSSSTLQAVYSVAGKSVIWHFGDKDSLNLKGTARTLDGADGSKLRADVRMEDGIISRSGATVVDDSRNHLLVPTSSHWKKWVACRAEKEYMDLYLFAYGHEYAKALGDYVKVAGSIPLPPKYAFGYWWSRYWQYSDNELKQLVSQIRSFDIPIDVLIVDMDWHETWSLKKKNPPKDEYGQRIGWTGYTWKEQLFPNPSSFIKWCDDNNLRTSLNLHPASGIQPYEECYDRFVKQYGSVDKGISVPFRIDEEKWADAYFDTVLGPMEKMGIDFWWLDWQQWPESKFTPGLSNTFWLNHVFQTHMSENESERPMIYHRWGGLGSHRYQVGFSGDATISWNMLSYMPEFTATATNVGYGYWGHDIGGHMFRKGDRRHTDPELYLRWLQHAVFTPIFKTHCTKDRSIERRIWMFPEYMFQMRDAIRLRYTLAPYIYTAAWNTYRSGVSMCRPMYYDYPECEEAYSMKEQYMFGPDIIATAICSPADSITGLSGRKVWFPEGRWYDCATGEMIDGGKIVERHYTKEENPWYVRAGAVIPMNPSTVRNLQEDCSTLVVKCYPGNDGQCILYEDDGISAKYETEYSTTLISCTRSELKTRIVIAAREGKYKGAAHSRKYEVRLPGRYPPQRVSINGRELCYSRYAVEEEWTYDGYSLETIVRTGFCDCDSDTVIELESTEADIRDESELWGLEGRFRRFVTLTPEFKENYAKNYDSSRQLPSTYLNVSQTPNFISEYPTRIREFIARYKETIGKVVPEIREQEYADEAFVSRMSSQISNHQ